VFISKIIRDDRGRDHYYIARHSNRSSRYAWVRVPLFPGPEIPVPACDVPEPIRERAYDLFEGDRLREQRP
jgi:hypothetical protein